MADEKEKKDPVQQAVTDAEAKRKLQDSQREIDNAVERAELKRTQDVEASGLQAYTTAQYENQGQILNDIQSRINAAKVKDETAQRKEDAYRYISGVGDTLSSLVNLVGTAHGASNQEQTYNSHAVVQKAEEARKARKIEMDDLSKRQDEMKSRLREMKAAGSLNEAQLSAKHKREQMALKSQQEEKAREAAYKERMIAVDEMNAVTSRLNAEKSRATSTKNPKVIKIMGEDGTMKDLDITKDPKFYENYQKALDAAIKRGDSGLTQDELLAYANAKAEANDNHPGAIKEFFRTHIPRETIINQLNNVTSITSNYP